jgi:hypothetical protein
MYNFQPKGENMKIRELEKMRQGLRVELAHVSELLDAESLKPVGVVTYTVRGLREAGSNSDLAYGLAHTLLLEIPNEANNLIQEKYNELNLLHPRGEDLQDLCNLTLDLTESSTLTDYIWERFHATLRMMIGEKIYV